MFNKKCALSICVIPKVGFDCGPDCGLRRDYRFNVEKSDLSFTFLSAVVTQDVGPAGTQVTVEIKNFHDALPDRPLLKNFSNVNAFYVRGLDLVKVFDRLPQFLYAPVLVRSNGLHHTSALLASDKGTCQDTVQVGQAGDDGRLARVNSLTARITFRPARSDTRDI